ncbi:DNA primase [Mangrovactinospora gilvigrisea]|uniref:DNA primase n=1 Tax=Mangrovactinospora gilvigrisea TaxID=1428644 RepID=A0A1J7C8S8_9ACTN|nr:DNA primase [Mangrovactinospora gilvigrisea]
MPRRRSAPDSAGPGPEERARLLAAAQAAGLLIAPAAHPLGYGCSCDRVGCPTPAAHPVSFGWQTQASDDPAHLERWLAADPEANFVAATGITHDVLDVPGPIGRAALTRIAADAPEAGPVAITEPDRYQFFTASRAAIDEDEWWPCELDCHPETVDEHPGLRWHCRGSYVLLPPSRHMSGAAVSWFRAPVAGAAPPDPVRVLAAIAEVWEELDASEEPEEELTAG